jgi:hypothetical protein
MPPHDYRDYDFQSKCELRKKHFGIAQICPDIAHGIDRMAEERPRSGRAFLAAIACQRYARFAMEDIA